MAQQTARPVEGEKMSDIAEYGRSTPAARRAGAATNAGTASAVRTGRREPRTRRTNKSVGFSSRPYWVYLIPGGLLFVAIILAPLIYNVYLSLTKWSGVGSAEIHRLGQLHQADGRQRLLGIVQEFRRDDHRDGGHPDADRPAARIGAVRLPRQAVRRLQRQCPACGVLPAAGAAGRGGRDRLGLDPPSGWRVQRVSGHDRAAGLHQRLARRPEHGAADGHAGDGLGADRLSGRHFHVSAATGRPGDLRGGRDRRRRLLGQVPRHHRPADQAGDLRGRADLHHRRAEGVRSDLRAHPRRAGERHQCAVLLRLFHLLQEVECRLRRGHRHRADPDHRPGCRCDHALAGTSEKKDAKEAGWSS